MMMQKDHGATELTEMFLVHVYPSKFRWCARMERLRQQAELGMMAK